MRLRSRFADEIKARLALELPEAIATIWDNQAVVVAVEQLSFKSTGGFDVDWQRQATIGGVIRAELRADGVDALEVEPLIANLMQQSVFLDYDADAQPGDLSERARFVMLDWRDTVRDGGVASALRFSVDGTLAAYNPPTINPAALIPQIGEPR